MLKTICYISVTKDNVSEEKIDEMLDSLVKKNAAINISGIIIYNNNNFLQIIEGKDIIINILYNKIKKGPRHHHIIKLIDCPIEQTIFEEYKTSFTLIKNSEEMNNLTEYLQWIKLSDVQEAKDSSHIIENYLQKIIA